MSVEPVLGYLGALVGFDTQNPPRNISASAPMWDYLRASLGADFNIEITDHGKGRVTFLAVRGRPQWLFNVHLDTVPVLEGARRPPLELVVEEGRAYGRGACDIKGAAACLLQVAAVSQAPLALLFTTDEEGAEGVCIDEFIAAGRHAPYRQVIVAEPTGCLARLSHRGYLSVKGQFRGESGHSSEPRTLTDSAIHRMALWASAALEASAEDGQGPERNCFNIGTIGGGVKSNVIADKAAVHWSARLRPGADNDAFLRRMFALEGADHAEWQVPFSGPPLPDRPGGDQAARDFATQHGLALGDSLDFWTEAALFSAAGTPALVFGPGSIEQAHTVNEWVSVEQLERALGLYLGLVETHA